MKDVLLTTESGSDPSEEVIWKTDLRIISMGVAIGNEMRRDRSFPVTEVFEEYRRTKKVPTTSAVNPQEYMEFFRQLRRERPEADIFHISYTSKASSTYRNAKLALRELGDPRIFLIDSENVSGGISLLLLKAAEILREADTPGEAVAEIRRYAAKARVIFLPDTLEYLRAGGRVSNAAYLGASLLNVKPLIRIENGELKASKKYRGKMEKTAFQVLDDYLRENHLEKDRLILFYVEGFSLDLLERLKAEVTSRGFRQVYTFPIGCVISCHGGPGAFGIAGFEEG